uniref:phosphatidylserine decarboxylase n=1 Tax=Arcella intermedia TaxID=1963864 RepID=A0A6B2L2V5_9EUKA
MHDEDDSNLLNASDMPEYEENHSNYFFWLGALVVLFLAYKKIKAEREYQKQKLTPEELLFEEETLFKIKKLPTGFLSRCWGYLTSICLPYFLQLPVNKLYAYAFSCNLEEAEKEVGEYKSLGDFFCRRLKEGARPLAPDSFLVSPVDGKIVHFGLVDDEFDEMEQIKEVTYSLTEFLGEDSPIVKKIRERRQQRELNYTNHLAYEQEATDFYYCIIYLAPGDYHGYHSPVDWTATQREHFPGHLFPVSYWSVSRIEGLFALNERVVVSGNWKYGEFSYTPVGAYNVGSMDLAFDEELVTNSDHPPEPLKIYSEPVVLNQGDNIGFFHLGSTVVLVFEAPKMVFTKDRGEKVKMGEKLAVKLTPELAHLHKKRIEEETIYMDTLYQRKLKALTSKEMTHEVISFKQERLWEQYRVRNKILKELRQSFYPKVEPDTVEMLKQKKDELRERVAKEKEEP